MAGRMMLSVKQLEGLLLVALLLITGSGAAQAQHEPELAAGGEQGSEIAEGLQQNHHETSSSSQTAAASTSEQQAPWDDCSSSLAAACPAPDVSGLPLLSTSNSSFLMVHAHNQVELFGNMICESASNYIHAPKSVHRLQISDSVRSSWRCRSKEHNCSSETCNTFNTPTWAVFHTIRCASPTAGQRQLPVHRQPVHAAMWRRRRMRRRPRCTRGAASHQHPGP